MVCVSPIASVSAPDSRFWLTLPSKATAGLVRPALSVGAATRLNVLGAGKTVARSSVTCRLFSGTLPVFLTVIVIGTSNDPLPLSTTVPAVFVTLMVGFCGELKGGVAPVPVVGVPLGALPDPLAVLVNGPY